jgi:predicted  nucleic acid-binding Zn-ribbon protein
MLDVQAQKLMEKAKELYADAEARADATIKAWEDLNGQVIGIAQWEWMVAEQEQQVREKEDEVTSMLEHGAVSSHPVRSTSTPTKPP